MNKPSFQEDHVSQVPALQLLQHLGYTYLRPQEVFLERKGKLGNVLLENILADQLRKRSFTHRGKQHSFSEANIVLFVNGIPLGVIECKRSDMKDPLDQAISQHIRNQADDYIPKLFVFSQLLLGVAANDAAYATTGTAAPFWAKWRELEDVTKEVQALVNRPLTRAQKDKLFADRFGYVKTYFDDLEAEGREATEQDRALYSLCRPERLIELAWRFIVYDVRSGVRHQ